MSTILKKLKKQISTKRIFRAMGTEAYIEIVHTGDQKKRSEVSLTKVINVCFSKVKIFNRFDQDSEICAINRQLKAFVDASPDMLTVAMHALAYSKESKGIFDPRILLILENIGYRSDFSSKEMFFKLGKKIIFPKTPLADDLKIWGELIQFNVPMDFSGIAKGYILDRMADTLIEDGCENFLIDVGGDMRAFGKNKEGKDWCIDIENAPTDALLNLSDNGIATSGITRRRWMMENEGYHHLIHPSHPYEFSFELLSVTAISQSAERADFLAKTLFLMGLKEGMKTAKKHSIPAIFIKNSETDKKNEWKVSPATKKYFVKK